MEFSSDFSILDNKNKMNLNPKLKKLMTISEVIESIVNLYLEIKNTTTILWDFHFGSLEPIQPETPPN